MEDLEERSIIRGNDILSGSNAQVQRKTRRNMTGEYCAMVHDLYRRDVHHPEHWHIEESTLAIWGRDIESNIRRK